jgi:hypothetical protein
MNRCQTRWRIAIRINDEPFIPNAETGFSIT